MRLSFNELDQFDRNHLLSLPIVCVFPMTEMNPAENLATESKRAAELIEWYWQDGCRRPLPPDRGADAGEDREKYRLPVDQWLARLYDVKAQLGSLGEARKPRRPALALWGLSQTGKSTALAFIDGDKQLQGIEGQDGVGAGLHWEGGSPFIYQPPLRNPAPEFWHGCAYNPFNGEDDGSSCLTRLVAAKAGKTNEGWCVDDPAHPVIIRLLKPVELLNTIARGYDTQCLGPEKAGRHEPWTVQKLEALVDKLASRHAAKRGENLQPDRTAFERVLLLIWTIQDLFSVRVETFAKLAEDVAGLRQLLDRLLLQKDCFISDPAAADEVTANILWGGSDFVTKAYGRLRAWHEKLMAEWGDREIHSALDTAMLFVDFGSGINQLKGKTTAARQRIQGKLIASLGYSIQGDRVIIDSKGGHSGRLGGSAEEYSMTQALVWELILPVNMEHLADSPGKSLLASTDILDFPGVGKDALNETSRLNLGVGNLPGGRSPEPTDFFGKILKRGKTASVVANYATRRNIDSFAILNSLKTDIAPSAEATGQILEGCESWARYAGYDTSPDASSPLPLHFILTFWGLKASQWRASTEGNFQNSVGKMIESFGWVRTRAITWALNYHWFRTPDGEVLPAVDLKKFAFDTEDYHAVVKEREFLAAFNNPVSKESFDQMLIDRQTGGLNYFLTTTASQLQAVNMASRQAHLDKLIAQDLSVLRTLCSFPYLRPPADEKDSRIETLVAFRKRIIDAAAPYGEAQVREVSHALREFLNVDPDQLPYMPLDEEQLDASCVDRLFFNWREAQLRRFDAWKSGQATGTPNWEHLRCQDREVFSNVLQAIIECLGDKVYASIAASACRWLKSLRDFQPDYQAHHLRRYVAAEMVNWLCYFFPDPEQPEARRRPNPNRDARWKLPWDENPEDMRLSTPCLSTTAWRQGPGPILDEHLAYVLGTKSKKPERPALPGDDALTHLLPAQD